MGQKIGHLSSVVLYCAKERLFSSIPFSGFTAASFYLLLLPFWKFFKYFPKVTWQQQQKDNQSELLEFTYMHLFLGIPSTVHTVSVKNCKLIHNEMAKSFKLPRSLFGPKSQPVPKEKIVPHYITYKTFTIKHQVRQFGMHTQFVLIGSRIK